MWDIFNVLGVGEIVLDKSLTWGWKKIKEEINKGKHESYETKMYCAIVKAIDGTTYHLQQRDTDRIYQAAELLIEKWTSNNGVLTDEIVKESLKIITSINENTVSKFESCLFKEISLDEMLREIYKISKLNDIGEDAVVTRENTEEIKKGNVTILTGMDDLPNKIVEKLNQSNNSTQTGADIIKFKNNKKQDYINKWNDVLFLHRGEPKDRQIKLRDVYILPDYEYKHKNCNNLYDEIEYFIHRQEKDRTLCIMGQAGLGKSSLVSYLANCDNDYIFIRLKDLPIIEDDIYKSVIRYLSCEKSDLINKTVILDGLDEADTKNIPYVSEYIWDIEGLNFIITSRLNYKDIKFQNAIYLNTFDECKINEFSMKYYEITNKQINIKFNNKDVLNVYGIPLILYMIHALDVKIDDSNDRCGLYSEIFNIDGGIYDKCRIYNGIGYSGDSYHNITSNEKKHFHEIAQKIAFAMFKKNSLELEKSEYERIVNLVSKDRSKDFGIVNYYDIANTLTFAHKSIYEYFIAEYIYQIMLGEYKKSNPESFAKELGLLLNANPLSYEIMNFLEYKIHKSDLIYKNYNFFKDTFDLMILDGMTFHTGKQYKNVIQCEIIIFKNMLEIIHVWIFNSNNLINFSDNLKYIFVKFIQHTVIAIKEIDLTGVDLTEIDLTRTDLANSYLINANLTRVKLDKANLIGAILVGTDLTGANLTRADLTEANLTEANLTDVNLTDVNLAKAKLTKANLTRADLTEADLTEANLTDVSLTRANLSDTNLSEADLTRSDLTKAYLRGANLRRVNLYRAILNGAIFDINNIKYIEKKRPDIVNEVNVWLMLGELVSYEEYKKQLKEQQEN